MLLFAFVETQQCTYFELLSVDFAAMHAYLAAHADEHESPREISVRAGAGRADGNDVLKAVRKPHLAGSGRPLSPNFGIFLSRGFGSGAYRAAAPHENEFV